MSSEDRKLIFVYGSLRKGEYNYEYFKGRFGSQFNYLDTLTIDNYDLYSLGSYPGIKKGKGELIVDVIECSEEVKAGIDSMELGANYSINNVTHGKYTGDIYIYEGNVNETKKVKHGDWTQR